MSIGNDVVTLRSRGYFLLPLPARQKFPPPTGWVSESVDRVYDFREDDNIAVATGPKRYGPVVVISNDGRATDYFRGLFGEPTVWSVRGGHWWFRAAGPVDSIPASTYEHGEMEMHSDGRYVLVPPAIHPSGTPYRWSNGGPPPLEDLPPLPDDIREVFGAASPVSRLGAPVQRIAGKVRYGARRRVLCREARTLAWAGLTEERIRVQLRKFQETEFPPERPGDLPYEKGAEYVARWAVRHHAPPRAVPPAPPPTTQTATVPTPPADVQAHPNPECWVAVDPEDLDKGEKPFAPGFVGVLERLHVFATIPAAQEQREELLLYRDGRYVLGAPEVREWVEAEFRSKDMVSNAGFRSHVIGAIRAAAHVAREDFDPVGLTNLANCVLEPRTGAVRPHAPVPRFRHRIAVAHIPGAACPKFLAFLERVLPDATNREIVQEEFGYAFVRGNPLKRGFYWFGVTDSGKSTLQAILRGLLGSENVACVPLQAFDKVRFASAELDGKYANLFPDLPDQSLRSVGMLKMLLGNVDLIRAEKKFQDAYHIVNPCKLFFSSNVFPRVEADDEDAEAFYRRWLLTLFKVRIPSVEQDPDLADRLVAEEGSGILNWALEGLQRLLARGRFPEALTTASAAEMWRNRADSLRWFLSAVQVPSGGDCPKDDFYATYTRWCKLEDITPLEVRTVTERLPKLLHGITKVRAGPKGRRIWVWRGISLPVLAADEGEEDPPA